MAPLNSHDSRFSDDFILHKLGRAVLNLQFKSKKRLEGRVRPSNLSGNLKLLEICGPKMTSLFFFPRFFFRLQLLPGGLTRKKVLARSCVATQGFQRSFTKAIDGNFGLENRGRWMPKAHRWRRSFNDENFSVTDTRKKVLCFC